MAGRWVWELTQLQLAFAEKDNAAHGHPPDLMGRG
jgi:hypothetical protein